MQYAVIAKMVALEFDIIKLGVMNMLKKIVLICLLANLSLPVLPMQYENVYRRNAENHRRAQEFLPRVEQAERINQQQEHDQRRNGNVGLNNALQNADLERLQALKNQGAELSQASAQAIRSVQSNTDVLRIFATGECPICTEAYAESEQLAARQCGHIYCRTCYDGLQNHNQRCAVCRDATDGGQALGARDWQWNEQEQRNRFLDPYAGGAQLVRELFAEAEELQRNQQNEHDNDIFGADVPVAVA